MHLKNIILALSALALPALGWASTGHPVDFVNPLVGSESAQDFSTGNTYPAVAMPWGMHFWTPQTGKNGDGWQYSYTAGKMRGLKQTHQPSPWINDYGVFSLMPEVMPGAPVFDEEKRASWFSHKAETATPYYYKAYLADYDVTAELTPTERACLMRFTFPEAEHAYVVLDAFDKGSHVEVIPAERKIVGYSTRNSGGVPDNFRCYFVVEFDKPFTYTAVVDNDKLSPTDVARASVTSTHAGAVVGFSTRRGERVHARVASSFVSPEQAALNLRELGGDSFEALKERGRRRWDDVLGRIEVEDDDQDHLRTFYSCLYRCLLFPRKFYEVDAEGRAIHYSPHNGRVERGYMYTDTGFWDTFRALFPLLNLVYPSVSEEVQQGLANTYRESGFLPEWQSPGHRDCMVGNNSASVVADAWLSGIRTRDAETLWQAVVHGAKAEHPTVSSTGRKGWKLYDQLGYVPCDVGINESAARTLEYAYDDWCIYRLGRAMGKPRRETEPFRRRAMNYRNLFDPGVRMMRGRRRDGKFQEPFSPYKWGDVFTEGNAWHWTWSVFHDPEGLISLMGGREAFCQMMDSVFVVPPIFDDSYYGYVIHEIREMQVMDMGNYAHGNQPIQHMLYLYDYAGKPWKGQYWIREVMDRLYNAHPDGYCGDEDNGQTSAWYVFSALGFYPVCPGSGQYALGVPYFRKAVVHLEGGKDVTISAPACSRDHRYVDALAVNGQPWPHSYLDQALLKEGATLDFRLADRPNLRRGTAAEDAPYSLSREK